MGFDVNWRGHLVKEYYEVVNVVFIHSEQLYGTVESLGAYASVVKYTIDDVEYEELIENEEFTVLKEIVFQHLEDEFNNKKEEN
jgi:hypothetical protein